MKTRAGKLVTLALLVLALTACPAMIGHERGSFDRTLKVSGSVDLDVQTGSGSITVRTGAADTVQVRADIRANGTDALAKVQKLETNPPIEQSGNSIRIGRINDAALRQNVSISYEITVPKDTRLRSHTGSGKQDVDGIKGPLDAETGSGEVMLVNIGADVRAHTGSGNIELDNIQGFARAEAGSGSIRANRIAGAFQAHTGSGRITLRQTAQGDVRADAGSGDIELQGLKGGLEAGTGSGNLTVGGEPTSAWNVHTGSGSVTLRLPQQAAFDLDAETTSGTIRSDHPVIAEGSTSRRELRGKVRGGGVQLEVRTGSGNIYIE